MKNNTLDAYKGWSKVADYESDATTVTLLNKTGKPIAEFNYPEFTASDFFRYKMTETKS